MNCPSCADGTLSISERQGIEIDYCHGCRGIWLDRGELDKLIERGIAVSAGADQRAGPHRLSNDRNDGPRRREHWLAEILD